MNELILMCGIPGCGKSTWINNHKAPTDIVVSRDEIRFGLLKEGDDYFSKEDQVWETFIANIVFHLRHGQTVFVDATHLNRGSRLKLLYALPSVPDQITIVDFQVPLEVALERNAQREGRARVPDAAIEKMYKVRDKIRFHEGVFDYNKIYTVNEYGEVKEREYE